MRPLLAPEHIRCQPSRLFLLASFAVVAELLVVVHLVIVEGSLLLPPFLGASLLRHLRPHARASGAFVASLRLRRACFPW